MTNNDNQDFDDELKNNDEQSKQNEQQKNQDGSSINKTSFVDLSMRNVDEILYNDNTHIIEVPVVSEMEKSFYAHKPGYTSPQNSVSNFIRDVINKPKENVNLDFEEILKLQPQEGKDRLGFVKLDNEDGVYLGEADYATPQGRGCYIFKNDGQSWIGYFDKGEKGNYGKFYDKDGRLTYEGEYKHGEKNGKGVYYYPNGGKYVGDFARNKKEGNGVTIGTKIQDGKEFGLMIKWMETVFIMKENIVNL